MQADDFPGLPFTVHLLEGANQRCIPANDHLAVPAAGPTGPAHLRRSGRGSTPAPTSPGIWRRQSGASDSHPTSQRFDRPARPPAGGVPADVVRHLILRVPGVWPVTRWLPDRVINKTTAESIVPQSADFRRRVPPRASAVLILWVVGDGQEFSAQPGGAARRSSRPFRRSLLASNTSHQTWE